MFRRMTIIVFAALVLAMTPSSARADDPVGMKWYQVRDNQVELNLYVFWSKTCPHCALSHPFLRDLAQKYSWLKITYYEISEYPENRAYYQQSALAINRVAGQVPAFFYCRRLDIGFDSAETSGARLEAALVQCRAALQKQLEQRQAVPAALPMLLILLADPPPLDGELALPEIELDLDQALPPEQVMVDLPGWGTVPADELSLPTLTVMLAGLDAFNPCAFFVLMILLSLMLHTQSRVRMLLVGGVFVLSSGVMYFLFMAAWLNLFFLIGHLRIITLVAGTVSIVVGLLNIKDYLWFKVGPTLSLSGQARSELYQRMGNILRTGGIIPMLAATAALGFAANLYELLCTAGFPMVYTRVLTLRELPTASYYGYLALYNVIYVLPLAAIVLVFALAFSAHKLTEYEGRVLKLLSGMMMLALGIVLLAHPEWMTSLIGASLTLLVAIGITAAIVGINWLRHRPRPAIS